VLGKEREKQPAREKEHQKPDQKGRFLMVILYFLVMAMMIHTGCTQWYFWVLWSIGLALGILFRLVESVQKYLS
jgi:hypothetical protein